MSTHLKHSLSRTFKLQSAIKNEYRYRNDLQQRIGGTIEYHLPAIGYIDLLTDEYIIELKSRNAWKGALGQLLVYSHFLSNKKLILALFNDRRQGTPSSESLYVCKTVNVGVWFYHHDHWEILL
jgi:hypothetical protein